MSKSKTTVKTETGTIDLELLRPMVSAADAGPQSYTKIHFDDGISRVLKELAERRSPTPKSKFRHLMGVASEAGVGACLGVPINRDVYPGFEGDSGHDLTIKLPHQSEKARVEVKATKKHGQPEREIKREELESADYFVLCRTDAPESYVEIVGYAPRPLVELFGKAYRRDHYSLRPDYLLPMDARRLGPEQVREIFNRVL